LEFEPCTRLNKVRDRKPAPSKADLRDLEGHTVAVRRTANIVNRS